MKNSKITFRQSVCYVRIVNFALLTRGHKRKKEKINDTVNQHFPHRIFLAFLSPLIACEDRKEIKWAIKLYLGEAPSISKLVASEGAQLGS